MKMLIYKFDLDSGKSQCTTKGIGSIISQCTASPRPN